MDNLTEWRENLLELVQNYAYEYNAAKTSVTNIVQRHYDERAEKTLAEITEELQRVADLEAVHG